MPANTKMELTLWCLSRSLSNNTLELRN
jgi:hypothetical protein